MSFKASKTQVYCILIILLSSYLALKGLDNNYFWDDEANTAIFAKNLLEHGELTGWDGRNLEAHYNGKEMDDNLIQKHVSPMHYYFTALSFLVFGPSTWAGRIPFVLVGIVSLLLLWVILGREGFDDKVILFSLCLLAFSTSFLLYIRQCRYYSLTIFFSLLLYLLYREYVRTRNIVYPLSMVPVAVAFFFSHYFVSIAFMVALLFVHLLVNYDKKDIPLMAVLVGALGIIIMPWTDPLLVYH